MQVNNDESPLRESKPMYADVIVPRHIAKAFTYLVPPALTHILDVGRRVLVPFGRATLEGAVVSLSDQCPVGVHAARLKEIRSLASGPENTELSSTLFELSRKVSEHYVAPWGQCLRLVFPSQPKQKTSAPRYVATVQGQVALEEGRCPEHLRPLLDRIARRSTGVLSSTLQNPQGRKTRQGVEALKKNSWIIVSTQKAKEKETGVPEQRMKPTSSEIGRSLHPTQATIAPVLPQVDPAWVDQVAEGLRANQPRRILVHAPWEHRISLLAHAVEQVYAMDKSVIILSGEVARAEWLGHLLSTVTNLPITFLPRGHGASSVPGRWGRIKDEAPTIVIGTRSAIFAPLKSIGLIWVDEEDDPALKEPQEPRYHAREVACMRAEVERALVILASSHPSLESKTDSAAEVYTIQENPSRQPAIELVDLRYEPGGTLFSQRLVTAIRDTVGQKTGVLLFLNRKGYAGALVCRECGWVPRCASCAVALTYYREAARLACRYCGVAAALPDSCPTCSASRLSPVGEGTERIEVEARRLFPSAKILRLDGDTLRRPAAARALWEGVRLRGWDILIGTQALFQREPLPHVGLVGIVQADSGLHVPDFRAAERTYQLLAEAVSVAQPASAGGRVILQTLLPAHYAIESIVSHDPRRFYDEELAARRLLGYPPTLHLVSLSVSGKHPRLVETAAQQWRKRLEGSIGGQESVTVLGPVPAIGGRPRGHYRYQILVKEADRTLLCRRVRDSVEGMEHEYQKGQMKFVVDVDPIEMG